MVHSNLERAWEDVSGAVVDAPGDIIDEAVQIFPGAELSTILGSEGPLGPLLGATSGLFDFIKSPIIWIIGIVLLIILLPFIIGAFRK